MNPFSFKKLFFVATATLGLTITPDLCAQCFSFTQEHVDLLSVQWNSASHQLSLMASDDTHGLLYASNQCVVICPESMKFSLPPGTPLGNEGDPLWILPQSPYEGVPYVGVSAETIAGGTFDDPLTIQLMRVEGPGQLIVWQTGSFGSFDIKMDTRDGIGANDKLTPFVGGHEHHNWGFTTSGVYRAYFQVSARLSGQGASIVSVETPFTIHVLPLKPFELWTATNWPCECRSNIIAAAANPDSDFGVNVVEYALGLNPKSATTNGWPTVSLVRTNGQTYGALTYTRAKAATDCAYEVIGADEVASTNHQVLSNVIELMDQEMTEKVTILDTPSISVGRQRFYQLRIKLK